MSNVSIEDLASEIAKHLEEYNEEVTEGVKDVTEEVMKNLVNNTKADAPVRRGKYKKAISSKTLYEDHLKKVKIWYVKKPYYSLTHLLNNGHAKRGGGRVAGDNHIGKNELIAMQELEQKIVEVIENGH